MKNTKKQNKKTNQNNIFKLFKTQFSKTLIKFNKLIGIILLSSVTIALIQNNVFAWGPVSPANNKWVTINNNCTFTANTSGLAYTNAAYIEIYNNGTWIRSNHYFTFGTVTSGSNVTHVANLTNQSPTDKSYWRIRFYKWDGYDMYGNVYGAGWTEWSSWAYFGVDFERPSTPSKISPPNNSYVKCSSTFPLLIDWTDSTDSMSGVKGYRLAIDSSTATTATPTTSQHSISNLSEGWHTWYVYSRDNCYGNAFDSSTNWESNDSGVWRFFVDNTPPTKGSKQKPNYGATAGATVPNGTVVAINPDAPIANLNDDNPFTNGIIDANKRLLFTWTAATDNGGLSHYILKVTSSNIGTINKTINAPNTSYTFGSATDSPFNGLPNGIYNWNVTAYDLAGNFTTYDSDFTVIIDRTRPTATTKTAPVDNFSTNNATISFSWNGASDNDQIRKYELYIAPEGSNYSTFVDCGTSLSKIQNISLSPFNFSEGKYKWNIKVYDRALNYSWYSPDFTFIYDKTKPVPGSKRKPYCNFRPDGQIDMFCTNSSTITFEWDPATDLPAFAPSGISKYELWIDGAIRYSGTNTSATITNLGEGLHTWNVKVYDNAGNFEVYGTDWQFKVDFTNPIAGSKIKPINNFKTNSTTVTLQWGNSNDPSAGGGSGYIASASGVNRIDVLCISGPINFSQNFVVTRGPISGTDFSVTSWGAGTYVATNLQEGVYTWNVRAYDRAGNTNNYDGGTNWQFTVDLTKPIVGSKVGPKPPNVNVSEYPQYSDVYISKQNRIKFSWTTATDNYTISSNIRYKLTIKRGSVIQYEKDNISGLEFTNDIPLPDGDYTWNITAKDEAGNEEVYGADWKIKVDTKPPIVGELYGVKDLSATPYIKPNANGIDINTGTPTFIWTNSTDPDPSFGTGSGIDRYRITIEIPRNTIKYDSGYTISRFPSEFAPNLSFKLPDENKLADDGPYYWTIWVRDVAGNEIKYQQLWNFYVDTLLAFETLCYEFLISRENLKIPGKPALYQPSPNYEVLVSGKPPIVYINEYTPATDIIPDPPNPSINKYGTTYYWSVRNQDVTGLWGKYEDYSVNIVTLVPGQLVKPVNKSYTPIKPKFEWTHSMPQEVRRKYRLVVYKVPTPTENPAWPAGAPTLTTNKVIDYETSWSDSGDLPLSYQVTNALPDGQYVWSVYAYDDMNRLTRYNEYWSFEVIRNPFITAFSNNLKWYAGYPNSIIVDAFGANGFDTLGTCEVTLYLNPNGTQPIRKFTLVNGSTPPTISRLDGDTEDRISVCNKLYSTSSFVITDVNYPSNKRYQFILAPHFNFKDKYPSGKLYAKVRAYYYDATNPGDTSIYTDFPKTGAFFVGEVENQVILREYDPNATTDTASVFFAYGISNSKKDYSYLTPSKTKPPHTLQYVSNDPEADDIRAIYYNGMACFVSPHAASSVSLSSADSIKFKNANGSQYVWRVTKFPNTYDQAMRTKLFKNPDYIPQNTYDVLKVLSEFNGTTPVEVFVTPSTWVSGNLNVIKNTWNEPNVTDYLDRGETAGNENTITKFETWIYASAGDTFKLTYSADMISQIFLNGEALPDQYNIYNQDESQRKNYVEVLISGKPSMLFGWNHLVIYVLHQKKTFTNGVNGICYKLEGIQRTDAFKGSVTYDLWHSFPMPQPNAYDFYNNGRGTAITVYDYVKEGSLFTEKLCQNVSGGPAIYSNHKGIFFADKSAMDKLVAQKPLTGGDHKISLGIISVGALGKQEPRFSTSTYGENGFIKMHINNTPFTPPTVNRINKTAPCLVCPEPYKDVESIATLKPQISVLEHTQLDPDNPVLSEGHHHSLFFNDYLTQYSSSIPSTRTDEIRYIYVIDDKSIPENFYDINFSQVKYKAPSSFTNTFTNYMLATHNVNTAFAIADEARNKNGVIEPIFYYRAWAIDEHGEIQPIGSAERRFCIDLTPPVVADIQVFDDRECVRLDSDISPFVENDKTLPATNSIVLVGHTITLWAYCTDEITTDPRKLKDGKFFIRKSGSNDPWIEVLATCEVDVSILYEDPKFAFKRMPEKHPNGYYWYAFYTIPYDSDLTYYDVDFQISDALGNRSQKLSESNDPLKVGLTKRQFKVGTLGLNKISVSPTLRSNILSIFWQPFLNWRDSNSISHYIVSIGELTPNPFETSNWVDGSLTSCTREVRQEGKLPVFVMPVEKINTVGFGTEYSDFIYSFEDPKSTINRRDGWRESISSGGYYSQDTKKVKDGMYSWSNFINPLPGEYILYKDFNIGPDINVTFGAWIKKETISSKTKLQAICYNAADEVINPNENGVTFETNYDNVESDAWVRYYLSSEHGPYVITPPGTRKIRLQIVATSNSKIYIDQIGFASYAQAIVDFTPPQKPEVKIGVFDHHLNTYDSATVFGYWDGQWDLKSTAWVDEPSNFPTLLASNLVNFTPTDEIKKAGKFSYKIINASDQPSIGYFKNADIKLNVEAGDVLRIWANFQEINIKDKTRKIDNIAIAFSDGTTWKSRIYYGNDYTKLDEAFVNAGFGSSNYIKGGEIADYNKWIPLDVDISSIGLSGRQISGIAFAISGTYENLIENVNEQDTIAVYIDFIDINSGAGVKNYLPQLEINRDALKSTFYDFSTLKSKDGLHKAGFMVNPTFDDEQFKNISNATSENAFTDKLSLKVSSSVDSIDYVRTGLTAIELANSPKIKLSKKLKLNWPSEDANCEYNGSAIVIWTYVDKVDYSRDSVSEINIGIEYSTLSEPSMFTIAKYRGAQLSPRSKRPPEFVKLQTVDDLLSSEVKLTNDKINVLNKHSLYKITDSFETELVSFYPFKRNFVDMGRIPPATGEWTALVIPIEKIIPKGVIVSKSESINIKSIIIETANCDIYVDHIGKTTPFKQIGDWQGNVSKKVFVQDYTMLTDYEIHNPEQSLDGTESIKLKTTYAGEKNYYLRLKPAEPPSEENPDGFDPSNYYLVIPNTGGILSVNVYLGTNEATIPEQIMLEFHRVGDGLETFYHRAFWGLPNIIIPGIVRYDKQEYYYMGPIPDIRNGWAELLIPTEILNMNNLKFDGIKIRVHSRKASGFEIWIDRIGMLGIVPHVGENERHSVYAWDLDDYTFYSMRVKAWDWVLNESEYAYSKYVRSKDRTPPIIEAPMAARINYIGANLDKPFGGVYYVKQNPDGSTSEVPLIFKKPDGTSLSEMEVDLSITTDDYLSFETVDASRSLNNKVSIGPKKLRNGGTVEILVTMPTARDPLPSAEYINSEWLTEIPGLGQIPEVDIKLNDASNIWLVDPLKRYSKVRYYFMDKYNYIARQIVYDDEGNFEIGSDTYIDVTPGPIARLAFYYPNTSVIDIKASEPAYITSQGKDEINNSSRSWVGVTAYDATGNTVLKGHKLKYKWHGYYRGVSGITYDMNASPLETKRRMEIVPGLNLSFDSKRPFRTYYEPPPRPYFQILRDSNSVELASKLLTHEQFNSPEITYCTQEVEIYTYTGYNIKGEAYEVGLNAKEVKNNLGNKLKSGDSEVYFVTTTHAGQVFTVTVTNEDESVVATSPKFRVVPGELAEMIVEPSEIEIEAEHGQATFVVKGFDSFRNKQKYRLKYHDDNTFDNAYKNDIETSTYEYISTNEIAVNPLWTLESHEVEFKPNTNKYEITNSETVGVFISEGRTSTNTFGAGWEHGIRDIWIVDTTEVLTTDSFGNQVKAAVAYTNTQYLSSGAHLRYGIQKYGWDINNNTVFIKTTARVIVKPLLKGYLSFKNHDNEPTTEFNMNAVIGNQDLSDALKFYIQTYSERGQISNVDSITEVVVQLDTNEDEFARLFKWPVTDITDGKTELRVKLDKGQAELGLVAFNAKTKPIIKVYSIKNGVSNYTDASTPDKRSYAKVNVYPNKLEQVFFEPDISDPNKPFSVVKGRSLPIKAYGYDARGNIVAPLEYQPGGGWQASVGAIKDEKQSASHLMCLFTAKDIVPPPGMVIPVEITLKSQALFKKLAEPKGSSTREVGIIVKNLAKGYLKVVNFGMFDFPCIYQELDKDKLDKDGEYELSFLYTTGDNENDTRPAQALVGIAYLRDKNADSVSNDDIHVLYNGSLNSGGKISSRPFKLRFKMDGKATSLSGKPNVNDLNKAEKIIVFLGAPPATTERPALRYDHVTIERIK